MLPGADHVIFYVWVSLFFQVCTGDASTMQVEGDHPATELINSIAIRRAEFLWYMFSNTTFPWTLSTPQWRVRLPFIANAFGLYAANRYPQDIYEFGMARGYVSNILRELFPSMPIWSFDSFRGLPAEAPGMATLLEWHVGRFGNLDPDLDTPKECDLNCVANALKINIVPGFFNESLTPTTAPSHNMRPAFYVDIDVDLYSSTREVLSWLFRSGLVRPGTLIGYDDWWTVACATKPIRTSGKYETQSNVSMSFDHWAHDLPTGHPLASGEGRAHAEIAYQFGVHFRCVAGPCTAAYDGSLRNGAGGDGLFDGWGPIFVVESIEEGINFDGHNKWDHGFHLSQSAFDRFKQDNTVCREIQQRHTVVSGSPIES